MSCISEDPAAWGYLPLGDQPSYVPDPNQTIPPFQLYTLGSGWLAIPEELKNVVVVKTELSYPGKPDKTCFRLTLILVL